MKVQHCRGISELCILMMRGLLKMEEETDLLQMELGCTPMSHVQF